MGAVADEDRDDSTATWLTDHGVSSAAAVVVSGRDDMMSIALSGDIQPGLGDPGLDVDEQFEVSSVTKTMVAAVALQLVEEGHLSLDDPLPPIDGIPIELTEHETLRRLLAHASGLVDYRDTSAFDGDRVLDPVSAVLAGWAESDPTSTGVEYAATNYFVVGLLVEAVTGERLDTVLTERLFDPLGMDASALLDNTRAGFVGYASGGVVSTLADLARWYDALFRRRVVLSPAMMDEMIWGGSIFSDTSGLGAWRRCPCRPRTVEDPEPFNYVFHDGGDTRVLYMPGADAVVALRVDTPLYGDDPLADPLADDLDGLVYPLVAETTRAARISSITDGPGR